MNAHWQWSGNIRFSNEIVYEFDDFDGDSSVRHQESSFPERRVQVVYYHDDASGWRVRNDEDTSESEFEYVKLSHASRYGSCTSVTRINTRTPPFRNPHHSGLLA